MLEKMIDYNRSKSVFYAQLFIRIGLYAILHAKNWPFLYKDHRIFNMAIQETTSFIQYMYTATCRAHFVTST